MKVGFIGVGAMGAAMAGHVLARGRDAVTIYDTRPEAAADLIAKGAVRAAAIAEIAAAAEIIIVMVANDAQVLDVTGALAATPDCAAAVVAVAATIHPKTMDAARDLAARSKLRLIDAPVVHGLSGAVEGSLLSLCGGAAADVEAARPVLDAYSREVVHVGALGHGQLAKAVNNMLHWAHCVSNFEALLLAKRYGMDAQALRQILLRCPAANGTLEHWDDTKLTWQEKDMDIVMDLAQAGGVTLPLFGQVDQLVKMLKPKDIADLLHGDAATYLGAEVRAMET